MLSIEKCQQLEPSLENLSNEEVVDIMKNLYGLAQLALEDWKMKKAGSKNMEWLLLNIGNSVK